MNEMIDFIERDLYAKHLGIEIIDFSKGTAKAKMNIKSHHLNSMKSVHGGAIFSLADAAFAVTSNPHGGIAMAINVSISYFKAVNEGTLYAEAREISLNRKLATYSIEIVDEHRNVIALFQGTVYRKTHEEESHEVHFFYLKKVFGLPKVSILTKLTTLRRLKERSKSLIIASLGSGFIVVSTIFDNPTDTLLALGITVAGLPLYWFQNRK